ncbi:MAG TPA: hypothetical protein VEL28_13060 [Candidatus Binatia bacterium]|nr:hypothetical protein [Candidatus Binatia bacterium]
MAAPCLVSRHTTLEQENAELRKKLAHQWRPPGAELGLPCWACDRQIFWLSAYRCADCHKFFCHVCVLRHREQGCTPEPCPAAHICSCSGVSA